MNNISSVVTKVVSLFKSISLKQVCVALMAGLVLFTTTACNPPSSRVVGEGSYDKKIGTQTELYDPIQEPQGGMNTYSDVDPRTPTRKTDNRAEDLVQNAKANLKNRADDAGDLVDNVKQTPRLFEKSTRVTGDQVRGKTEDLTDDFAEGTKRGVENLQENIKEAGRAVRGLTDDAGANARNATEDLVDNARGALRAADRAID